MSPGGIKPGNKGCWANRQIFEDSSAAISVHRTRTKQGKEARALNDLKLRLVQLAQRGSRGSRGSHATRIH
jgi:hypothetical protein